MGMQKTAESSKAPGQLLAANPRTTSRVHPFFFCLKAMKIGVFVWERREVSSAIHSANAPV